jgi:hypothetical protein
VTPNIVGRGAEFRQAAEPFRTVRNRSEPRLLLPFALLAAAIATPWLPDPLRWPAAALQAVFYLTGAADLLVPERHALKRLTSPVRTFLVLMAATFCAASILFHPRGDFWKPAPARKPA